MDKKLVAKELLKIAETLVKANEIMEVDDSRDILHRFLKVIDEAPKAFLGDLDVGDIIYDGNISKVVRKTPKGQIEVEYLDEQLEGTGKKEELVVRKKNNSKQVAKLTPEEVKQLHSLYANFVKAKRAEYEKHGEMLSKNAAELTKKADHTHEEKDLAEAYGANLSAAGFWNGGEGFDTRFRYKTPRPEDLKKSEHHQMEANRIEAIVRAPDPHAAKKESERQRQGGKMDNTLVAKELIRIAKSLIGGMAQDRYVAAYPPFKGWKNQGKTWKKEHAEITETEKGFEAKVGNENVKGNPFKKLDQAQWAVAMTLGYVLLEKWKKEDEKK